MDTLFNALGNSLPALFGTLVGGLITCVVNARQAKNSYRYDRLKRIEEKKMALYEKCLSCIVRVKDDPSLSLSEEYLSELISLSGLTRVYAADAVRDVFLEFGQMIVDRSIRWHEESKNLENRNFAYVPYADTDDESVGYSYEYCGSLSYGEYEKEQEELKKSFYLEPVEAHKALGAVSDAIKRDLDL